MGDGCAGSFAALEMQFDGLGSYPSLSRVAPQLLVVEEKSWYQPGEMVGRSTPREAGMSRQPENICNRLFHP